MFWPQTQINFYELLNYKTKLYAMMMMMMAVMLFLFCCINIGCNKAKLSLYSHTLYQNIRFSKKISQTFKRKIHIYVICRVLQELEEFIIKSNEVLSLVFDWDDSNSLLRILNILNQINEYEPTIKSLFPSLKKIIHMIMQYDIKIPKKCSNQVGGNNAYSFWTFYLHERKQNKFHSHQIFFFYCLHKKYVKKNI